MNVVNSSFVVHPAYTCRLTAGQSVAVLPRRGQRTLGPGRAAVLRAEHLPLPSRTEHGLRIARARRHGHHRAAHGQPVIETPPSLSEVLTAVDGAVPSHGRIAECGIECVRI